MYHTEEKYPLSKRDVRPEAAESHYSHVHDCLDVHRHEPADAEPAEPFAECPAAAGAVHSLCAPETPCLRNFVYGALFTVRLCVLIFVRPSRVGWIVLIAVGGFYTYTNMQAVRLWKYRHQTS